MDFNLLKTNKDSLRKKLQEKVEKLNSNESFKDDRFWKLDIDKAGNGSAVIRFLPAPENEDFPFVRYWSHQFKGVGGWLWENCPTSIGKDCPVCAANTELWNTEEKANQDIVRIRKRKLTYISNILVINDLKHIENNGKVLLFKYGQMIFGILNGLLNPDEDGGEEAKNPFDLWEGCDFKLRSAKVAGYVKYEKSTFLKSSPVAQSDKEIQEIWKQECKLSEFVDVKNFLSYEDLKTKFNKVVGNVAGVKKVDETEDEPLVVKEKPAKRASAKKIVKSEPKEPEEEAESKVDAEIDYFSKLTADDDIPF
jgi:hypothetical protein